ncbi:MAG TPA: FecR domain-containing protein [Polyangiaceae bacterium]
MSHEKPAPDLPKLRLNWDAQRTERLLGRVHARLDGRRRAWRVALAVGTLASAVAVIVAVRWTHVRSSAPVSTDSAMQVLRNPITLREGSEIALGPAHSEVRVLEESPSRVRVDVVKGSGRYSVVPNAERTFEVRSGLVTVTVVGTEFVVEQRGEETWVEVSRGKVRVSWGSEQTFLGAGESGIFPRPSVTTESPASAAPNLAEAASGERPEVDLRSASPAQATQVYRSRVARHDYHGAYAVLAHHPSLAGDTVEELLTAADVARLSDHPAEALPYLQRVIREHPRDERGPMAAFTLGRTLSGLGRTQEAMVMFGRVRTSWPRSPLAEDALLRQAEAASQIGDLVTARRLAEQYDRDYPNGRRRSDVRRYARLE